MILVPEAKLDFHRQDCSGGIDSYLCGPNDGPISSPSFLCSNDGISPSLYIYSLMFCFRIRYRLLGRKTSGHPFSLFLFFFNSIIRLRQRLQFYENFVASSITRKT